MDGEREDIMAVAFSTLSLLAALCACFQVKKSIIGSYMVLALLLQIFYYNNALLFIPIQEKCTTALYMDLRKAVNTANHTYIIEKLPYFGTHNTELEWLTIFFIGSNRSRSMDIYLALNPLPAESLKAQYLALYYSLC